MLSIKCCTGDACLDPGYGLPHVQTFTSCEEFQKRPSVIILKDECEVPISQNAFGSLGLILLDSLIFSALPWPCFSIYEYQCLACILELIV